MGRERRDFVRRSGLRDARLFVIASEGAVTEPRYFNGLKERWHNPRIHVEVLIREQPGLSSPQQVLKALDRFKDDYQLRDGDQLWVVIDRDSQSWKPRAMASAARECEQKEYFLAVSNPCFEIWLLLHFEDVPKQSDMRKRKLIENANSLLKTEVARHCSATCEYIDNFLPHTRVAIARGEVLDSKPGERWPSQLGTRVYRLVRQLIPDPQ
jgi:hypothetical protein